MMAGDHDSGGSDPMIPVASAADQRLVEPPRLCDEAALAVLVDRYHGAMARSGLEQYFDEVVSVAR